MLRTYVVRIDIPVNAFSEQEAKQIVIDHANNTPALSGDIIEIETTEADS
jgi:hypothetical protein